MDEQLKILCWNCQGLGNKKSELLHFIRQHKIHIILLNETHLNPSASFKLPNYDTYRNDRTTLLGLRCAGGTAILVANRLVHYEVPIQTNSLENTTIHIQINNRGTRLSAIYKRPINSLMPLDIDNLLDFDHPTILAGDMNAKHPFWNSRRTNATGLTLLNHMEENNYFIFTPDTPTHNPDQRYHQPDVLDIAILKDNHLQYQLCNFTDELSSDYSPVILTLRGKPSFDPSKQQLNITNWPKFAVDLHLAIPSPNPIINTTSELNQEIENFTTTVQVAMTKNTSILDNQSN